MLQRNSSRRGSLGRRKSTSSVRKHEPIDPEVGRQQAQTAATLAFARANVRMRADGSSSRNNTGTYRQRSEDRSESGRPVDSERPVMRRQQSVRFVGPSAVPRRQALTTRSSQLSITPRISNGHLRPRAVTTDAPVPAQYRPPSRSSSIGKASIGKATNLVAAMAYDEYYTQEDDVASTPSSYRRIRKSKSMFSPLKAPSVFYNNGSPDNRFTRDDVLVGPSRHGGGLRAPNSMSFLRGGTDYVRPGTQQRNDVAVQIARDKFLHNVEQQRLRAQPSFLFRSRKARETRENKPFRRSVRSSSQGESTVFNNAVPAPKELGLIFKARKASAKIKNRLKKVFGQSRDGILPSQQVEATRTHVQKYNGDDGLRHDSFVDIAHPTDEAVSRVTSRNPTLHAMGSEQRLRSMSGSVQSMRSENISVDKSRVTSWATTNNNTISSQSRGHARAQAQYEADRREQERLSIIKEHGTHQSSASFARRPMTNQYSAYPVIHSQQSGKSTHNDHHAPMQSTVDSARVYSALMKRLDENSPQAKLAASRRPSADSLQTNRVIQSRSSSLDRRSRSRSRGQAADTIKHVDNSFDFVEGIHSTIRGTSVRQDPQGSRLTRATYEGDEQAQENMSNTSRQWQAGKTIIQGHQNWDIDDVFSPDRRNESNTCSSRDHPGCQSGCSRISRKQSINSYHTAQDPNDQQLISQGLSPQEIALKIEPVIVEKPKKTVRESRSTFFGSTTMTLPRTTSPYRRALAERDYNPTVVTNESPLPLLRPLENPLLLSAADKENKAINSQKAYSESIYSRTTSGRTPLASTSNLVLPFESHPAMASNKPRTGDAIVIETGTYRPSNPQHRHPPLATNSSSEWRGWMSNQVAVLENINRDLCPEILVHDTIPYMLPTMPVVFSNKGHVREVAQLNDDGTDVVHREIMGNEGPLHHSMLSDMQQNASNHTRDRSLSEGPQRHVSNFINDLRMNRLNLLQNHSTEKAAAEGEPSPAGTLKQQNIPVLKPILKKPSTVSLAEPPIPHIPTPPPMPPRSPLRQTKNEGLIGIRTPSVKAISLGSAKGNGGNFLHKRNTSQGTLRSVETPAGSIGGQVKNVLRKRNTSQSTLKSFDAPTRTLSRNGSQVTLKSVGTPAKLVKRNRPDGSVGSRTPASSNGKLKHEYVTDSTQILDAQQMGSKRMVDMFLSSRRRQITGGSASDGSEGLNLTPREAFI